MKILFFKKNYKLTHLQSETIRFALLDSLRLSNEQIANYEHETTEFNVLTNKIACLQDVMKELGLTYDD